MSLPDFPTGGATRLKLTARDAADALAEAERRLETGRGFTLATLNLDHLVKLRRSEPFRRAYLATDIVVADGNPVVWLSRLSGQPVSLAPGSELVAPLAALAARRGWPVALYGATAEALGAAATRLAADHPGLRIALTVSPPFGFDPEGGVAEADARRIAESGARLCFVALGAPKQEIFASRAAALAPACGFASIGAGLDFIAGAQRRAPRWVRRMALEWLWRAASDPLRLGRRYLDCALLLPGLAVDAWRRRTPAP
jgi:exopolysaccharide biosynthesis WecB/TagA/CpsF family protein